MIVIKNFRLKAQFIAQHIGQKVMYKGNVYHLLGVDASNGFDSDVMCRLGNIASDCSDEDLEANIKDIAAMKFTLSSIEDQDLKDIFLQVTGITMYREIIVSREKGFVHIFVLPLTEYTRGKRINRGMKIYYNGLVNWNCVSNLYERSNEAHTTELMRDKMIHTPFMGMEPKELNFLGWISYGDDPNTPPITTRA